MAGAVRRSEHLWQADASGLPCCNVSNKLRAAGFRLAQKPHREPASVLGLLSRAGVRNRLLLLCNPCVPSERWGRVGRV